MWRRCRSGCTDRLDATSLSSETSATASPLCIAALLRKSQLGLLFRDDRGRENGRGGESPQTEHELDQDLNIIVLV
eukprot:271188-Amorphochlora_amoeboformis.AAC.2